MRTCRCGSTATRAAPTGPPTSCCGTDNSVKQHYNAQLQNEVKGPEAHALECIRFAEAVANKLPSPVPAEQSLDVLTILDGLYRSAAAGAEIRLD